MPVDRLFVILGAGASADAATDTNRTGLKPPLVGELFAPAYYDILDKYKIAQEVAADIGPGKKAPLVIEQFIRDRYRGSTHSPDQRKYLALPPYLQELLWTASRTFARSPDNYLRLMSEVLRLPEAVFVTLNYDTILDERLHIDSSIAGLDDYIATRDPQWSLIKLHGSVNWGREVLTPGFRLREPARELAVADEIEWLGQPSERLDSLRSSSVADGFYPALSVPVGQEDELVCPPAHVEFLREKLRSTAGLHLLVIGYSANDQEVLRLIRDSNADVASLMVVNLGEDSCRYVLNRLRHELGFNLPDVPHNFDPRGFASFTVDGLRPFIDGLLA